ncbi:arfaptin-1 isoform X2 [Nothobranchius furzeri]|uniref:Transcript variant X3 n=3 Tax=Nothobranchius furzeri TaxID=105023 RepID=A0A9D3BX79_NOTFU|nr:arfaptin-1 isoform X2 [Nothobranchius furzeri]KAF7223510.1 transcript variant X3 [Nothobranchius furzeri]
MSEVSLEAESGKTSAEDPQQECEEADKAKESLSEDPTPKSVDSSAGGEDRADVLYDVDINSNEDDEKDVQVLVGAHGVGSGRVGSGGMEARLRAAETPVGNRESPSDAKESTMAEDSHRSSAAEIPVTSNGELDQSPESVFQRDAHFICPGPRDSTESRVMSSSYASTAEGIVESGPYKDSTTADPKSGAVVLSDDLKNPAMEKLDLVRKWSINTYKCTRQILSEKLGRGSRTVDLELEAQIDLLRDNKRKYQNVIKLAQMLATQLSLIMQTQRQLGDAFADLSLKSPELHEEFGYNAETQKLLSKNGDTLLAAINFFISSVNTLVDKTIEDTMINIKQYEVARVEYDAYRTDLEELNLGPRDGNTMPKIEQSQQQFQIHREKYERMRNNVSVKLKFLEENKVKVLHNQLMLFHNAIAAYYAGNQEQLEQTLKQFHIKLKMPGGESPSWLEEH